MTAGLLLTGIVEQPLSHVFPDRVRTIKPHSIDLLNFDDPAAAAAGDPQQVALDLRQRRLTGRPLERARGSWSTDCQYSGGSGSPGASTGSAGFRLASTASFSICFGAGMRQFAGRSVILELEHNKNERVEVSQVGNSKNSVSKGADGVGIAPARSS